jgi:GntR family transcriptional regulator
MPELERREPQHLQIASYYKARIMDGRIGDGDQIPGVRVIMSEWGATHSVAQRAIEHLRNEGLVRTTPRGTFAVAGRAKPGPQQRLLAAEYPAAERVQVLSAGLVPAPAYIVPILGPLEVKPGFWPVIRREWITCEDGDVPFMLSVSWCPAEAGQAVPELLAAVPLPDPGGAAKLIAARTGRTLTWGRCGREARRPRDDGREVPLLRLAAGERVLAEVCAWAAGDEVLEYREDVLREGKVIESDMDPAG